MKYIIFYFIFSFPSCGMDNFFQISKMEIFILSSKNHFSNFLSIQNFLDGTNEVF
jgi:hypothetical protein